MLRRLVWMGVLWLTGCGPSLQVTPRDQDLTLSGSWVMPAAEHARLASDLRAAVEQSWREDERRMRRTRRHDTARAGVDFDTPAMDMGWLQQDREKELEALIKAVVPSEKLVVEQHTLDAVDFKPEGAAVRHFDTRSSSTLMTAIATWRVVSGWQDRGFVVISRDSGQSMTITERYQRRGDVLLVTVTLSMPDVKLAPLSASYRLTS